MSEAPDPNLAWPHILDALSSGDIDALQKLLWPSGATSGGEGMAMMNEANDRGLGRKIWLLKSEGS